MCTEVYAQKIKNMKLGRLRPSKGEVDEHVIPKSPRSRASVFFNSRVGPRFTRMPTNPAGVVTRDTAA